MLNDRIYVNGHYKASPSTSSSYRSSSSSSSSHNHSSNHSPSPLPSRRIHFNKDKSNSPSSERLNSSFNRGKDGIFRPKSLMSLATEIDYTSHRNHHSSSPSSSYNSSSALSSNPRLAQFRSRHREGSVPRQILTTSVDTGGYSSSSPRSRTRTLDSNFYSHFNDNLSYLSNSSSSSAYSSSRHRSTTSSSTSSYLSSSTSISSSPYQSYRFTTAYYAPKLRERPLLSNLRLKFAPTSSISNSTSRPSHSSINSSRTTSVSSNHSSSNGNSVCSSETAVGTQSNARLERNKFLIKFREHNNASPRSSGKRRSSISWDIPGETNFPKPSAQVAESLGETIQEVETPQPQLNCDEKEGSKELWKTTAETPPPLASELPTSTNEAEAEAKAEAITSVDENNNNLTRWNDSLALNQCSVEELEPSQSGSAVSLPPPPASPSPVPETRHSVTMSEQCDLALSVRVSQTSAQSQPLTSAAAVFDLTTSSGESGQSKQTAPAPAPAIGRVASAEEPSHKSASEHQQLQEQQPELVPEVPAPAAVKVEKIKKKRKVVESKLMTANELKSEEKARGTKITDTALTAGQSAKVVGDQTEEKVINSRLDKATEVTLPLQQPVISKTKSEKTAVIGAEKTDKAKGNDVTTPGSIKPVVKTKVLRAKTGPIAKIQAEPKATVETIVLTKVAKQSQVTSDESKSLFKEQSKDAKILLTPEKVAERKPKSKIDEKIAIKTKVSPTDTKEVLKTLEQPEKVFPTTKPKSKIETKEAKEAKVLPEAEKVKVEQPKSKVELKSSTENQAATIEEKPVPKEKPKEVKPLTQEPEKVTKPKSKPEKSEIKVVKQNQVDLSEIKIDSKEQEKSLPLPEQKVTKPKSKSENTETKAVQESPIDLKATKVLPKNQEKAKLLETEKAAITKPKSNSEADSKAINKKKKDVVQEKSLPTTSKIDLSNEQPNKTFLETLKPENIFKKVLPDSKIEKSNTIPIEQTPKVSTTETEKKVEKAVIKEPQIDIKIEKPKKSKDITEIKSEKVKEPLSPPPVTSNKTALKVVVPEIKEIRSPSPEPPVVTVKLPPKHAIAKAKSTEEKRPLDTKAKPPTEPVIKHAKTVTFAADQSSTKELPKSEAIVKTDDAKLKVVKKKELSKKKTETEIKPAPVIESTTTKQDELTKTETETKVEQPKKRRSKKKLRFREYTVDDFTFLAVLGRGSFGKVLLAEVKGHNVCFAVKCLKKQTIIEDDDVESIMIERKVLAFGSSNPFICKLFCTFQTESHLFFAMELCSGGDLMFHVQKEGKFSEEKSRFYACEILCALWFMHKRSIIYRDLKLDNIMIFEDGHIRLVDFGMCQGKMYREELLPCNFCGTPEYMAPEIVQGVKYNHSVDYWALGVVIYEMVVGTSPFHGTDEDELLWNVCHQDVHYPRFLSDNVKDLIVLLLKRNPSERLGIDTSLGSIESQPWFAGVNWRLYEECKVPPPFVPELNNETDVSYFDRYFTKEKPVISSTTSSPISEKDQLMFEGFNYTNHHMTV